MGDKSVEQDVSVGELAGSALDSFRALVSELYLPLLREAEPAAWGRAPEEAATEFMAGAQRLVTVLGEAAASLAGGVELRRPERRFVGPPSREPPSAAAVARCAGDSDAVASFDGVLAEWAAAVDRLVADSDAARRQDDDAGPASELAFWRDRMAKLNSVLEQQKAPDCALVLDTCAAARSPALPAWRATEGRLTEAVGEAKDNVKYLTTLEKSFEPLYREAPLQVLDALPALLNNVKMLHAIARYYGTTARMTTLFSKITVQMIKNCQAHILAPGKLYDQDKPRLLANLQLPAQLNAAYQEQYRAIRDRLAAQADTKPWDFDDRRIFVRFDLFCKRTGKLTDLFTTIHQFAVLSQQTHIDGLQARRRLGKGCCRRV